MITNAERKGNTLVLTIQLNAQPVQSKSAIEKARKEWDKANPATKAADGTLVAGKPFDVSKVPATLLASTGGFTPAAGCKVSLNVIAAS